MERQVMASWEEAKTDLHWMLRYEWKVNHCTAAPYIAMAKRHYPRNQKHRI